MVSRLRGLCIYVHHGLATCVFEALKLAHLASSRAAAADLGQFAVSFTFECTMSLHCKCEPAIVCVNH